MSALNNPYNKSVNSTSNLLFYVGHRVRWSLGVYMKRYLLAIALLPILVTNAAFSADARDSTRGIIGILPLPEVFGAEPCDRFNAQDIKIFQSPSSSTRIGRIYVSEPWTFPPSGGCQGLKVSVEVDGPVHRVETLPTLEFSYEKPGAIVRKRKGKWFEIALDSGYAWVHVQNAGGRYLPVEQLLKDSLTYLSGRDPLTILSSPRHGEAVWSRSSRVRSDLPVEVTAFQELGGELWVQVRLLEMEPCSQRPTGIRPVTGWIPFHNAKGMPSIWFYSRGC